MEEEREGAGKPPGSRGPGTGWWWGAVALVILSLVMRSLALPAGDDGRFPVVRVAVVAPLSGPLAPLGRHLIRGARLAAEEWDPAFRRAGWVLELVLYDDATPSRAVAQAELLSADPAVVGVVGHLDSAGAIPASERYHQHGLAFVAPASTAPELTERGLGNVFRLLPRDEVQGAAAARMAAALKVRRAFLVHDGTVYGQGLADAFKGAWEGKDGTVAGYRGLEPAETDFRQVVEEAARAGAELLFYGGQAPQGASLLLEARARGLNIPFLAGDGLDVPWLRLPPPLEPGAAYHLSFDGALRETAGGRQWAEGFHRRFRETAAPVAAYGFDATRLLLQAILASKPPAGGLPPRPSVVRVLHAGRPYEGVALPAVFNARGDNALALPQVVRLRPIGWRSHPPIESP